MLKENCSKKVIFAPVSNQKTHLKLNDNAVKFVLMAVSLNLLEMKMHEVLWGWTS